MVGVDVGGTHDSSLGVRGFRLAARVVGDYRSGSAGPRRSGPLRTASRQPATPAAGIHLNSAASLSNKPGPPHFVDPSQSSKINT